MIRHQIIESHIPLPKDSDRWPTRYAIRNMKIGESFVHIDQDEDINNVQFWNRVNGIVYSYGSRYGFKMKVRKIANRSVRVWRVE